MAGSRPLPAFGADGSFPLDFAPGPMRSTIDTYAGTRFRWNCTVVVDGVRVPGRSTSRTAMHLHPSRVRPAMLAALNPGEPADGAG